tara:strand:- start:11330 stop:13105 length:1776 start_codon:yes stop_codon:yes gene_type:complete
MGLMETLRNSTKYIIILLIGSFGILWVLSDVGVTNLIGAGPRDLGSVNGDNISFEEYQQRIQYYTNAYTQQTGNSMTPEMTAYYESQVWEELVSSRLVEQKMDELGITVTDKELLDMVFGDNPDPIIVQNFQREDGTVDRASLNQVMTDPNFAPQALALDNQLRQKRRQEKLSNFITAGLQVTSADIEQEYIKNNSFVDVSYVRFPFAQTVTEEITVSDSELKKYYSEHKEKYKQDENYQLKYVTFSKMPTAADTVEITKELMDLRAAFASAENDSLFLVGNAASNAYSGVFVDKSDVRDSYKVVLDLEKGEVSTPFVDNGQLSIIKKVDEKGKQVKFVVFSRVIEALYGTINDANEKASDFQLFAAEETDFDSEAERIDKAVNTGIASKGNSFISGLGSSQQVLNFLEKADEGDISAVYELPNSFVVVQLTDKVAEGYRSLESVKDQVENQVKIEKRKTLAKEKVTALLAANSGLEELATAADKEVQTATNITGSGVLLPGAGREPEVIGMIFGLNEGEISKALVGTTAVYVVSVDKKSDANLANLDATTRSQLEETLAQKVNQRFVSVWLEQLKKEAKIVDNRSKLIPG